MLLDTAGIAKIGDFGISRENSENTMTKIGTPDYMAPEMFKSNKYTEKVDIYSFGILMCAMMSGRKPFDRSHVGDDMLSPMQIAFKVVTENLRPEIPEKCPENFAEIMRRCWHHDTEERYSIVQLVEALEAMTISS